MEASRSVIDGLRGFSQDHDATITLDHEGRLFAQGQEVAFTLALRNLLVNAIKHNGAPVNIEVSLTRRRNWNLLTVKDDGCGIPKRLHEKVFDCFYSGNNSGSPDSRPAAGAGVGLYLVKRNITNMGGKIKIESEENKGCTFYVMLPAYKGD